MVGPAGVGKAGSEGMGVGAVGLAKVMNEEERSSYSIASGRSNRPACGQRVIAFPARADFSSAGIERCDSPTAEVQGVIESPYFSTSQLDSQFRKLTLMDWTPKQSQKQTQRRSTFFCVPAGGCDRRISKDGRRGIKADPASIIDSFYEQAKPKFRIRTSVSSLRRAIIRCRNGTCVLTELEPG